MEATHRAPAAGETPPTAAAESSSSTEESRWLASLSEPELVRHAPHLLFFPPLLALIFLTRGSVVVVVQDFLISFKMLAVKRAETAGRPHLVDAFDLRTLRALGIVDEDADANVSVSSSDSEVFRRHSKDQPEPSGIKSKRKKMQDA
ncbi:hypothetical protein ACQ4PT_031240 [Festuca glaucescens]